MWIVPEGAASSAGERTARAWPAAAAETDRKALRFITFLTASPEPEQDGALGSPRTGFPEAFSGTSGQPTTAQIDPRREARVVHQALFSTSFSKSQETGPLRLIDSFTMCATAAACWPVRPSSTEVLRVRTESKKRPM